MVGNSQSTLLFTLILVTKNGLFSFFFFMRHPFFILLAFSIDDLIDAGENIVKAWNRRTPKEIKI